MLSTLLSTHLRRLKAKMDNLSSTPICDFALPYLRVVFFSPGRTVDAASEEKNTHTRTFQ